MLAPRLSLGRMIVDNILYTAERHIMAIMLGWGSSNPGSIPGAPT